MANWSASITDFGTRLVGADDIGQCVQLIMSTQKGSSPLRPTFGVDLMSFLDKPVNIAAPLLRADMLASIKLFEPRAEVKTITFTVTADGQTEFNVTWGSPSGGGTNSIIL